MAASRRVVEEFAARRSRGDLDGLFELIDPDVTWRTPGRLAESGVFHHRDDVRQKVFGRLPQFLDGPLVIEIDELLAEGERVIALAHGRARRIDGGVYTNRYAFAYRVRDGRIVEFEEYLDTSRAAVDLFGKRLVDAD